MGIYFNPKTIVRAKHYTVGGYMLATGADDIVDTFVREYTKTVKQTVEEFGIDNVSNWVKEQYDKKNYQTDVPITHIIQPNAAYREDSPFAKNMRFESCYYEDGQNNNCLLYTSPSPRDGLLSRMPSSA